MTLKYFNVKNGLTTGNIVLNAGNSNIAASTFIGNINVTNSANLGAIANVTITGGTANYVLSTDGSGNLSWVPQTGGGGGDPGGSNTQIQFNDDGIFGGNSDFTFDKTTGLMTVTSINVSGDVYPTSASIANLGSDANRFNDLYLKGTKIELADSQIRSNSTALILTNPIGGTFTVLGTGNATTTSLANGNSSVNVNESNVVIAANGNLTVMTVTGSDVGIQATLGVSGNITAQSNLSVSGNLSALDGSFGGEVTTTGNMSAGNISTTGDLSATGNISAGYLSTTGTLSVVGNSSLTGNLEVGATSIFKDTLIVGSSNTDLTRVDLYTNGYVRATSLEVYSLGNSGGNISTRLLTVSETANIGNLNVDTINTTDNLIVGNLLTSANANLGNLATANFFQGDGYLLTNLTIEAGSAIINENSNVSVAPNANVTISINGSANVVTFAENETTIEGNLIVNGADGISVTAGNVSITGDLTVTDTITAPVLKNGNSNVTITANGNVSVGVAGTPNKLLVTTNGINVSGSTNITGTLTAPTANLNTLNANFANVNGNLVTLNADLGNLVTANFFQGDGYLLTNLTIEAGSAILNGNSNVAVAPNANVTITAEGNANVVTVTGNSVILDKQLIGTTASLTTANINTLNANVLNANNSLTINGDITANGYANVDTLRVRKVDGLKGTAVVEGNLSAQDNLFVSGYANIPTVNASSINVSGSVDANGTVTANYIVGSIRTTTANLIVSNVANINGINANSANVNGLLSAVNIDGGNLVTANFFQGDGYLLSNLTIPAGTAIENGNSNVFVIANSDIRFGVAGVANMFVVSNTSAELAGSFTATGNANTGNLGTGRVLASGNVTAAAIISNGNISGTNLSLTGNANISGAANVGGNIVALNADLGNLVTANFFQGDGYLLTNLTVGAGSSILNGSSNVLVTPNADINFTVEGIANVVKVTAEGVIVTGNIVATQGLSNGTSSINLLENSDIYMSAGGSANVFRITGSAINANAKINAFDGLSVTGNSNVGNLAASGIISAGGEISAGSLDTSGTLRAGGNANLANVSITGVLTAAGNITGANFKTSGTANVAELIITSSGANITGNSSIVGDLDLQGNAVVTGNLTVHGNTNYINVNSLVVQDPVIELGGGANGAPLTTNDGKDRGSLLHYYTSAPVNAFMGWDNSNAEFAFGSNVSITNDVVTFTQLGNIRASYFFGNILGNISGNVSVSGSNTQVLFNDQGLINAASGFTYNKSTNTFTVSGNAVFGNVSGNGSALSSITGANVTGQVGNALVAGTVYTAAQPNITSVGLLSALSVGPNSSISLTGTSGFVKANSLQGTDGVNAIYLGYNSITGAVGVTSNLTVGIGSAGNITANGNVTASHFIGNASSLTSIPAGNITGQVANALVAGTVYTAAQPNITSVGTLSNLTSNGTVNFTGASNVTLGAVGNIHISGGTANYVLSTDGSGNLSWVAQSGGGGGGTPGGSNTQIQFNDDGSFSGDANLVFDKDTTTLTANNFVATSTANLGNIGNLTVIGGSSGQVIQTDGTGNLSWTSLPTSAITVDTFTGDGVETTFTLTTEPNNINQTLVNIDGVFQLREAYTLTGADIVFDSAPVNGSIIEVTITQGISSGAGSYTVRNYTGNGVQTDFTVSNGVTETSLLVAENGILQVPTTDYTVSGSTLTFTSAPANGMAIQIRELGVVVAAPSNSGTSSARSLGYSLVFGL